jgi:ketosteroid isomerase-like protein
MSQESLDAVRMAYEAINSGDPSPVLSAVHDEMEFHEPASLPYGGTYRGSEGMGQLFIALADSWDGLHLEIEELIDAGDCVAIRGRLQGRSKSTGSEVDEPYLEVLRFREGKVVAGWIQMDTAKILQALGRETAPTV